MSAYIITLPGNPSRYIATRLPDDWEAVGEIRRHGELAGGALIRNINSGMYARWNSGSMTALDQRGVALGLAATAGVDLDAETLLSTSEAAELTGRTRVTINRWKLEGLISPVPGPGPDRFRKADVLAVASRPVQLGRPRKA